MAAIEIPETQLVNISQNYLILVIFRESRDRFI